MTTMELPCLEWPGGEKTLVFVHCPACKTMWVGAIIADRYEHSCPVRNFMVSLHVERPRRTVVVRA